MNELIRQDVPTPVRDDLIIEARVTYTYRLDWRALLADLHVPLKEAATVLLIALTALYLFLVVRPDVGLFVFGCCGAWALMVALNARQR